MSWLYTIVFAGLMFSSADNSVSNSEPGVQICPAPVERPAQDETEKFAQSYPVNANGKVSVSNINGSIVVEAWDRNEVKLEYTKTADSQERLADVDIRIDAKPESFSVETDYGNWKSRNGDRWKNGGKLQVDYHLMIPRGAFLNEIETVNGSVTVSNFVNFTKISAVNGTVNAANLRGTANLSTVNGEVIADFDRLETGSKIVLSTVNGHVNLAIPSDSSATIKADSLNGNISNDFGLPVRKGKYIGRDLYGRIGGGDVRIKLDSVNGALAIGRKNDGKTLSPATNLLPQKEKDDEDWDKSDHEISTLKSGKINKDIEKAVKESQKVSVKAMADAQKEIERIKPEIARIDAQAIQRALASVKSDEVQAQISESMAIQKQVLAKIANIDFSSSVPRVEQKSETFPVKGVPQVTVDAKGCSVTVRGWDKAEVSYSLIKIGRQNKKPEDRISSVTVRHTDSEVTIKVAEDITPEGIIFNDQKKTRLVIYVPKKSNLKIKTNSEIRLEGVSGDVDLSGVDESINVRDSDGTLRVSNSDGRIRVIGFRGEIDAQTSDGTINLEGDFSKLRAHAGDGSIVITLPQNASADIESNSGSIKGDGVEVVRISGDENLSKYRIGKGGALFRIETEGEIQVRGAGTLQESYQ